MNNNKKENLLLNKVLKLTFENPEDFPINFDLKFRRGVPYFGMYHPDSKGVSEVYINARLNHHEKVETLQHEVVHIYLHDVVMTNDYKDGDKAFEDLLKQVQDGHKIKVVAEEDSQEQVASTAASQSNSTKASQAPKRKPGRPKKSETEA